MIIYVIVFGILTAWGLVTHFFAKSSVLVKLYCIGAWLVLTILAALRWGVGIDYNYYYNTFFQISGATGWGEVFQLHFEPGYLIFTRCVTYFTANIVVYLFLFYGLMYGLLMYYIYKYSEIKWSSIAAFFAFDYFAMSLCFMRQGMAMVIGLFAFEMMKQKKTGLAVLLALAASMFHLSALVLLLCIMVSLIDVQKKGFRLYVVFSLIMAVGCDYILKFAFVGPFAKYAGYLESPFMKGNHILIVYYPIAMFILVVCFYKHLCSEDERFRTLVPVLFLGAVFCVMSTKHYLFERFSLYITFYNIRIVPQLLSAIRSKLSKDSFYISIYCTIIISISAYTFGLMNDRYGLYPYRINDNYMYQVPLIKNIK